MKKRTSLTLPFGKFLGMLLLAGFLVSLSSCAAMLLGAMGEMDSGGDEEYPEFEFNYEESPTFQFTILQMNDVYEIAALEKGKVGGLARVATVRNNLFQDGNDVLTVMAGDFLSPSLIGTLKYEGERIAGRQMVEVMNQMGVNVVAFGNHEFDISEEALQARMNESNFDWIGTNVLHQNGNKLEPFYKESYGYKYQSPENYIWEVTDYLSGKTLKVGFYSATINSNPRDFVYYEDPYQEATKAYLELAVDCDIILGLTHLSLEEDLKLATVLPKTALIMGGHEHENSLDTVGNVVIAKADANAKTVYVHRFTYDSALKVLTFESELVPITSDIEDDPEVAAVVERWLEIQHQELLKVFKNPEEVIYTSTEPLDGRESNIRTRQTNLGGIIAASMANAARRPVDCALFNSGSIRLDDQLVGKITPVDVFRALPFGGKLYEIEVKGSLLKKALNAGLENYGSGGFLQWHQVTYDEAAKTWSINGQRLSETKTYRVMTNDYTGNGREERLGFFKPENFVKWETASDDDEADLRSDVRRAVVAYLNKQ